MTRRQIRFGAAGLLGGAIVGALAWSSVQRQFRRDLFSRHPLRRFAALGYLGGSATVATAQLLREYIVWERRAPLRARAERLLRHVEAALG